jgi:hypothetical protein
LCCMSSSQAHILVGWWPSHTNLILFCHLKTLPYSSQSQSHIATDGHSVSNSWCRAPSEAHDQIFITLLTVTVLFFCGAPSLTRGRVCLLYVLLALASAGLSWVRVPWYSRPYFTVSDLRLSISSPLTTHRVTVEVFDTASTRVSHIGIWLSLYSLSMDHTENTTSNSSVVG